MKNVIFLTKNVIRNFVRKHFEGKHNFGRIGQNPKNFLLHKF